MIEKKILKYSIWFSLVFQILIMLISLKGIFLTVPEKDIILIDILKLETIVQIIELIFYCWVFFTVTNIKTLASTRYFDWVITTPTMLLSTIIFMKYQEFKEKKQLNNKKLTFKNFIKENKQPIVLIFLFNLGMLFFGYLAEINYLSKFIAVPIGFLFFQKAFNIIYFNYANKSDLGLKLFYFTYIVWGMYGIAALLTNYYKNIFYNILDIISKNFYGLFIYYKILQIST